MFFDSAEAGGCIALALISTGRALKALLENAYADEKIEAHEHMRLRRMSDEVLEKFLKLDGLSIDLKNMVQHVAGFVDACISQPAPSARRR